MEIIEARDEKEVDFIIAEMKSKGILIPEHLNLAKKVLLDQLEERKAEAVRRKYSEKIRRVEEKIFLWSSGSRISVEAVIVNANPTSFAEKTGILTLEYKYVEKLGERKLLGLARHEIGHVLYTRHQAIEEILKR
mgnify:CR=1 FL=1